MPLFAHSQLFRAARVALKSRNLRGEINCRSATNVRRQGLRLLSVRVQAVEEETTIASCVETGKPQLTISKPLVKSGTGLHSGEIAEVKLLPAAAGNGRWFVLKDADGKEKGKRIPAAVGSVRETTLSTWLGGCGTRGVRTVEHLLSALEGLGVDNCLIEISGGNEVPLLDGSAVQWVDAIEEAGICIARDETGSSRPRKALVVKEPVTVWQGDSFVTAFPATSTRLTCGIDFSQVPAIGKQWCSWSTDDLDAYRTDIAPARTFGILEQIKQLQAGGLIKGGTLENALVCSAKLGWVNPPLRYSDEPCRHKLLDLIGDLALCAVRGHPGLPVAHVVAYKASHSLHVRFGEALLQQGTR